ncbi:MAG: hypothetical protein ABIN25_09165 [Ginsengibacter sp.]
MKTTKLKMLFTAAGLFALSATFAQDTTTVPKMDTSKMPMTDTTMMPGHDSMSMSADAGTNTVVLSAIDANSATSVALVSEDKVARKMDKAAKKQAKAEKKMEKADAAKSPDDNKKLLFIPLIYNKTSAVISPDVLFFLPFSRYPANDLPADNISILNFIPCLHLV